jgi:4-diphosphocytidyl-2-C-methyl-D-erythritol kinase
VIERAPAKFNLCLFLGPTRPQDGRHELVTIMEPLELADTLTLAPAEGDADEVVCPGVEGPNLAAKALAAFREATGWDGAPVRLTIDKRIPVAAGMGGGSSDAAAALRLAERASGLGDDALLLELAMGLGADVPSLVRPGRVLATGAGEHLRPLPPPRPYGVLVLPSTEVLSTPAVFREADRLGLPRDAGELEEARISLDEVLELGRDPITLNELEPAARSLSPAIDEALDAARTAGARRVLVSGSGPTVIGIFDTPEEAQDAAERLSGRHPAPVATRPWQADG